MNFTFPFSLLGFMVLLVCTVHGVSIVGKGNAPCGHRYPVKRQPRILGGNATIKGEVPWIASLKHMGGHVCGATIFHKRYVIVAAHCIFDLDKNSTNVDEWSVGLGQYNVTKRDMATMNAKVEKIILHPEYNNQIEPLENDIGILKLSKDIKWNLFVQPACLPKEDFVHESVALAAGWGHSETGDISVLRSVNMTIFSNHECEKILEDFYNREKHVPDTQLCAGWRAGGRYIRNGDSGGGLFSKIQGKWTVGGIASYTLNESKLEGNKPSVFTKVHRYVRWLRENSKDD